MKRVLSESEFNLESIATNFISSFVFLKKKKRKWCYFHIFLGGVLIESTKSTHKVNNIFFQNNLIFKLKAQKICSIKLINMKITLKNMSVFFNL